MDFQPDPEEAISTFQAVREARGKITYQQLWYYIQAGTVEATQPGGKGHHYRVRRGDLARLLAPVTPRQEKN